jgi:ABC-type sugar transport system ATPase subunit
MTASVAPLGATTPLLQANGLSKTYAGIRVLNGINLTLWPGQILALVGENGSGKSTIIKILSGAIRADEGGTVLLNGQRIELESPLDAERAEIVTVYQELSLFPFLSVTENLFYADFHRMKGRINWSELHRKAETFLRDFGVDLPVRKLVSTLSIADRQMLEIAKALHRRAKIMILDEPTAVLGGADVDRLLGMVKQLQRRGVAVISSPTASTRFSVWPTVFSFSVTDSRSLPAISTRRTPMIL